MLTILYSTLRLAFYPLVQQASDSTFRKTIKTEGFKSITHEEIRQGLDKINLMQGKMKIFLPKITILYLTILYLFVPIKKQCIVQRLNILFPLLELKKISPDTKSWSPKRSQILWSMTKGVLNYSKNIFLPMYYALFSGYYCSRVWPKKSLYSLKCLNLWQNFNKKIKVLTSRGKKFVICKPAL